jgi:hypothetical protein
MPRFFEYVFKRSETVRRKRADWFAFVFNDVWGFRALGFSGDTEE